MKRRLRVGILGSSGRMGTELRNLLAQDADLSREVVLCFAASGPNDPRFETFSHEKPQVLIDFSAPETTLAVAEFCAQNKVALLVGTTGFSEAQKKKLKALLGGKVAWALVPNTSVGIYALRAALAKTAEILGEEFKIEIVESHHEQKKDAPSGTAKLLAETVQPFRKQAIGIHSLRGGSEVGEHEIHFLGPGERIQFNHRAGDRSLFARGAFKLASALSLKRAQKEPYSSDDLFA